MPACQCGSRSRLSACQTAVWSSAGVHGGSAGFGRLITHLSVRERASSLPHEPRLPRRVRVEQLAVLRRGFVPRTESTEGLWRSFPVVWVVFTPRGACSCEALPLSPTSTNMSSRSRAPLLLLHAVFLLRVIVSAHECTPCSLRTCPAGVSRGCERGRAVARDPCGCCPGCTRLEWEACGGPDWTHGYCALGLTCASANRSAAAESPEVGFCKVLPDRPDAGLEDARCPLITGCDRAGAQCVCDARHSCLGSFSYPDHEACTRDAMSDVGRPEQRERQRERYVGPSDPACLFSGCNLTAGGCVCESQSCSDHFAFSNRSQCQDAAEGVRCSGVSCAVVAVPSCPEGSVLTRSYTPPGGCCPSLPPRCTCDLRSCSTPSCPAGQQLALVREASGRPGDCCSLHVCQKVSPQCVHSSESFSEGEVYRIAPCWLCQCRGGISFCSKAECAELDCDNFYIPDGECCPVCIDVELLSVDSSEASCWVNNKLRSHEERWKEDDCTFCQCVDGEPRCTAMACKQSCHNPVKIPGECCPFCEEPSYETVSPLLCPPLENCSLSGSDCPHGFTQDANGCLLCHCVNNASCPDLGRYCSLQCIMGYERDDFGCEVCECSVPTTKCRPLTCTKTCPYGYVRNKHGCEMCRCVKCPPFTCDKHCGAAGYRQNRKGCNICMCKETGPAPTVPAPPTSFCLTSNGLRYEEGDGWHDGCRDCYCHAGREMCVLITCPVPSCPDPLVRPDQCCPTCEEESGSGQPDGVDLVVCRAPGGELYVEGETWNLDRCTRCTCRKGRVLCDTEVCPPALCQTPARNKETCCHVCPEESRRHLPAAGGGHQDDCLSGEGEVLLAGDSWRADACTSCSCTNGSVQCFSQRCGAARCRLPVLRKGQCCPHCLETTAASLPVIVSTAAAAPDLRVTTAGERDVWITTATVPAIVTETVTVLPPPDERRPAETFPSHTEMALIYQSAAWILAGLLLAVIIFIVVALLLNKKKKWVQMSCYSAPKKTVILKKHVNQNSVVYMEPSKENKFQNVKSDCGVVHFSSDASDKMSFPRAKLSNEWTPR